MSLKLKAILTTTMLLTSLAAVHYPASPVSAFSEEAIGAGKALAEAKGIVLNSDADAAELAVLNRVNGGVLPQIRFGESGSAVCIDGLISGMTVRSRQDAKAAIRSVAHLLGIEDADAELTFYQTNETEHNTSYIFRQVYRGIGLENAYVTVYVNNETGKADYLNSGFVSGLTLDTVPAVTPGKVRSIIREAYDTGLREDAALTIFEQDDRTLKLAYAAKTNSEAYPVVYVDAQDGSILFAAGGKTAAVKPYTFQSSTPNPINGLTNYTVKTESYNVYNGNHWAENYRLVDPDRNIWMIGDPNGFINFAGNYCETHGIPDPMSQNINSHWGQQILNNPAASQFHLYVPAQSSANWDSLYGFTAVLYQVERAYDFYDNVFSWKGTDNVGSTGGRLFIYPCLNEDNAYAFNAFNYIQFGLETPTKYHYARDLGVVAHEYTHRVMNNITLWAESGKTYLNGQWGYCGEAAAMSEGYADIMGEYAKMYYNLGATWKAGFHLSRSGQATRDITKGDIAPSAQGPGGSWYYFQADLGNTLWLEAHAGSTIISHAAYMMDKLGIPRDVARQIWFNSMDYLVKGRNMTNFANCRDAVCRAAQEEINRRYSSASTRRTMMKKVYTAFNKVHIFSSYSLGDINLDGAVDTNDVTLVTILARNANYLTDAFQLSQADLDYDGRVTMADADKLQRVISLHEAYN